MQPYGSDRVRESGGKVILHSRLSKGWTPRTPKSATHAEFPGTAVLWDDRYFEVLSADPLPAGGVRYTLGDWKDEHTFRVFETYSEESEARLRADHETALRHRRHSRLARLSSMILGHLPGSVQERLANELGLFPARMTLMSLIPPVALFGACVWLFVDAKVDQERSPVPSWLWFLALFMMLDTAVRFLVAMSQNRGIGSIPGTIGYVLYRLATGKRDAPPKLAPLPVPEEIAQHDSVEWRSWMFTLLPAGEQRALAQRYDYDYRKDAYSVAGAILAVGVLGILSSVSNLETLGGLTSLIVASLIALEQIARLLAFKKGPAGSVWGALVRPFIRDLLKSVPSPRSAGRGPG
ncbi:MAG TPA: hypothetical protein VEO54_25005 [Thermoanaerobaculia bacterium]|nr:hypothetical protein [Thermoanaerobaculia bacterium]